MLRHRWQTERSNGAFGKNDIEGKAARGSGERARGGERVSNVREHKSQSAGANEFPLRSVRTLKDGNKNRGARLFSPALPFPDISSGSFVRQFLDRYTDFLSEQCFLPVVSLFVICSFLFTGVGGDSLADCVHFHERNSGGAVYPAHDGSIVTRS